jgi:membrane protease YdiL (CAAX protease family)
MESAAGGARTAPWWHTLLVLMPLCASSLAGASKHSRHLKLPGTGPRMSGYLLALAVEWFVVLIIWLWLRSCRLPMNTLIRGTWRGFLPFFRDLGIAVSFLIIEMPLTNMVSRLFHLNFDASAMLPHSPLELCVWIGLAATAGFCEEIIFRGYLTNQFACWIGDRTGGPLLAITLQGIAFGLVHAYQGKVIVIIVLVGWLFGGLAWWRRSLLPGMLAHGLQDGLGGILGFISR